MTAFQTSPLGAAQGSREPLRVAVAKTDGTLTMESWIREQDGTTLTQMQQAVGGLIDVVGLADDAAMIVRDDGAATCPPNLVASAIATALGRTQPVYFGDVVFVGGTDRAGNDLDVPDWLVTILKDVAGVVRPLLMCADATDQPRA